MAAVVKTVAFFVLHGGPADHLATYAQALKEQGHEIQVYAAGAALKKFQDRNIEVQNPFALEKLGSAEQDGLASDMAKACSKAHAVFTDVGHEFSYKIQQALATHASEVPRVAYYDNLEPFVPGGYSTTFAKIAQKANIVLFANKDLADAKVYSEPGVEIDLSGKKRLGIGYYPVAPAETILERRKLEHDAKRAEFLAQRGIEDKKQKILVYFGGNNAEYFSRALPAFLSFLPEASGDIIVVFQQHPGAKEQNQDGGLIEKWNKGSEGFKVILSDFSSDDAQVLADAALYYQTSMGPQFVIGGNPVVQIGHEPYADIVVRNGIAPTVASAAGFADIVKSLDKQIEDNPKNAQILRNLILSEDWPQALGRVVESF